MEYFIALYIFNALFALLVATSVAKCPRHRKLGVISAFLVPPLLSIAVVCIVCSMPLTDEDRAEEAKRIEEDRAAVEAVRADYPPRRPAVDPALKAAEAAYAAREVRRRAKRAAACHASTQCV